MQKDAFFPPDFSAELLLSSGSVLTLGFVEKPELCPPQPAKERRTSTEVPAVYRRAGTDTQQPALPAHSLSPHGAPRAACKLLTRLERCSNSQSTLRAMGQRRVAFTLSLQALFTGRSVTALETLSPAKKFATEK